MKRSKRKINVRSAATNGNKPAYKIPSMKEIEELEPNGFKVVSTFSGGGGSSLGYKMAGFKVLYANEFIPEAQKTYRANFPNTYLDTRDIREVKPEEILEITGLKKYELDILDGSPPCASFSTAGAREKHWGEKKKYSDGFQRVDDLFFEYIRILRGLMPKCFVAENVTGLVKGKAKGYFKIILKELKDSGYRVKAVKINAAYLGVPQKRERIIFLGVRKDLNIEPVAPTPFNYTYSLKEALKDLPASNEESARRYREEIKKFKVYSIVAQMIKNPKRIIKGTEITGKGYFCL